MALCIFTTLATKVPYLTFCDKMRQFFIWKWIEREEKRENEEILRVNLSPFPHSLSIFSQPGWQAGTTCAAPLHNKFDLEFFRFLDDVYLFVNTKYKRICFIDCFLDILLSNQINRTSDHKSDFLSRSVLFLFLGFSVTWW